jgi:hypothetical protein
LPLFQQGTKIMTVPTTVVPAHLEKFFSRVDPVRGRLIFALDATASRQPTWDAAAQLQSEMFATVAAIGGLDVQLVFYRGYGECSAARWQSNAQALAAIMARVTCAAGHTQIRKVLEHARKENAAKKVNALVIVSDACEESPISLYTAARTLDAVPVFMFQEGGDEHVEQIYCEIARLTGGAYCRFDSGAAQRLADLLKAVAAFAAGECRPLLRKRATLRRYCSHR